MEIYTLTDSHSYNETILTIQGIDPDEVKGHFKIYYLVLLIHILYRFCFMMDAEIKPSQRELKPNVEMMQGCYLSAVSTLTKTEEQTYY